MSTHHKFDVRVTPEQSHIALKRFVFREAGVSTMVLVFMLAAYVAYELVTKGGLGLLSTLLLALIILFVCVMFVALQVRKRQAKAVHEQLGAAAISYSFDGEEISATSPLGTWSFNWALMQKLSIDPDLILLFYARNAYFTIPTDQLPQAALDFLQAKVVAAGGEIEDRRK